MNKVITINLDGTAYQLEEGGYDALRAYLETAKPRGWRATRTGRKSSRTSSGPSAEKFRALLNSHKTVVVTKEVAAVMAEMGPIEADPGKVPDPSAQRRGSPGGTGGAGAAKSKSARHAAGDAKRLYRISEGAMFAGVCNGIAAYLNMDPTLVRLAFVLLTMFWGTGLLVYVIMAIVVPEARSRRKRRRRPATLRPAQEFIRRAKAGYYEAIKGFPDRQRAARMEAPVQAGNAGERG